MSVAFQKWSVFIPGNHQRAQERGARTSSVLLLCVLVLAGALTC